MAAGVAQPGPAAAVALLRHTPFASPGGCALAATARRRRTVALARDGLSSGASLTQTIHFQNPAGVGNEVCICEQGEEEEAKRNE